MTPHKIEVYEGGATITLASGDHLYLSFTSTLGVEGYGVHVTATRTMAILPTSGNAATITTPRSMTELEARVNQVIEERGREKKKEPDHV